MKKLINLIAIAMFVFLSSHLFAADALNLKNKILFVNKAKEGGTYLSVIDPNGKNKVRLTPTLFNIILPKNNPVTGEIAFTNQTENMTSEIYILDNTGKHLKKILTNACFQDFSPDGKTILYTTTGGNPELFVYDINKKKAYKVSQSLKVCSANYSPDGEWIVVSDLSSDGSMDMHMISCYGRGIIPLVNTPKVNEAYPVFCLDNKKIAYYTNRNNAMYEIEILGVGLNEEGVFDLNRTNLKGTNPSFSPNGEFIVFQNNFDIMIGDTNGKETLKLVEGRFPYWTK